MTPLWHISSHYLEVGVFMLLFKNGQSHLTEINCCFICLVMSQWLVPSKAATWDLSSHASNAFLLHSWWHCWDWACLCNEGPLYSIVYLFTEQTFCVAPFIAAEWRERDAFSFYNQHWNILKLMSLKFVISESLILSELSHFLSRSILS